MSGSPFETSFESLTTKAGRAAKSIVKAAADTAGAAAADVVSQVTGDYGDKSLVEEAGLKQVSGQKQQQIQQQQQVLNQTRTNLEQINLAIKKAREERIRKEQESRKVKEREVQKKKIEEEKKKEDPLWKKVLKGGMGSKEIAKNVGG